VAPWMPIHRLSTAMGNSIVVQDLISHLETLGGDCGTDLPRMPEWK